MRPACANDECLRCVGHDSYLRTVLSRLVLASKVHWPSRSVNSVRGARRGGAHSVVAADWRRNVDNGAHGLRDCGGCGGWNCLLVSHLSFKVADWGAHPVRATKCSRGLRCEPSNKQPDNNALERTRRVGVPAARAVVRVSPRRSTRCSTSTGKSLWTIASVALVMLLGTPRAEACSCRGAGLNEEFASASMVFEGYLEKVTARPPDELGNELLSFRPVEVWKGPKGVGRIVVLNRGTAPVAPGSMYPCPFTLPPREQYIVLTYSLPAQIGMCSVIVPATSPLAREYRRRLRLLAMGVSP